MRLDKLLHRWMLGLVLVLVLPTLVLAEDPDRIEVHKPLPSTAMVLNMLGQGAGVQGSGFLVDRSERYLLTNHHVARTKQDVEVLFPVYDMGMALVRRDYYLKKAPRIKGKCVVSDALHDLALIKLESVPNEVPEVRLAEKRPKLDERTHLMGNPGNSAVLWVYGSGKVKFLGDAAMDFSAPNDKNLKLRSKILGLETNDRNIGPGASGGPAVNDKGDLVGVIQSGAPDARQINCIDVSEVRVFLAEFHRSLATEALRKRDYNEAIARCTKALKYHPEDALSFHERGTAYAYQQRQDEAIADYSKAVQIDPQLARTWRSRATAYFFKGNYEQAVADCTEAIKADPKYAQAYMSRSRAYEKLGKRPESVADYDRALKLDPSLR